VAKPIYLSIFLNVQLLKRLVVHQKDEIDPNLPHANKVLLQGSTRILIYIDGLLSVTKLWLPLLSYLLPFSRTFNCTVKRRWFTKGAEIDPNLAKVLPKVAHAFYTLMDFSSHQTVAAILPSSIFPNVQLH
jgi:hypothetical protein